MFRLDRFLQRGNEGAAERTPGKPKARTEVEPPREHHQRGDSESHSGFRTGTAHFAASNGGRVFMVKPPVEWQLMFRGEKRTLLRNLSITAAATVTASGVAIATGHGYLVPFIVVGGVLVGTAIVAVKIFQVIRESYVVAFNPRRKR